MPTVIQTLRACRVRALIVAAALLALPQLVNAAAFDLEEVSKIAEKLSRQSFADPKDKVPKWLSELNYDQWRDIRFRPDKALWKDGKSKFNVQFFHPGLYYDRAVEMHVIEGKTVRPILFNPSQFDYGKNDFASRVPQNLGYAGFRVHYPINKPDYGDEVIVFVGASYFRALGKDLSFGMSARGVAVDTAVQSGEEFPFFKEFWLVKPAPDANELIIYALLDSPRVTGAYRFRVKPGEQTVVEVQSRLFTRAAITKLGIAPLTSMYFHGENSLRKVDDFRPEVHDSDGVLLNTSSGEWMWRPVDNPESLQTNSFRLPNPKGFGLLQRDRDFDHYQDLEARQEERPSTWVVPKGEWGDGHLDLVQIPTKNEMNDNIAAFWVPEKPVAANAAFTYDYDLYWYGDDKDRPPAGRVVATRRDHGPIPDAHRFVVDFEGGKLKALPPDTVIRGVITAGTGSEIGEELLEQHLAKNPITGGWRLGFQVKPKNNQPLELRAFLQKGNETLTETWSYTVLP